MNFSRVELHKPTLEQRWRTAESNLIYFVICGIAYAKSRGDSPEDFGTFAGEIAGPYWQEKAKGKGPPALIDGISWNKHQFHDFEIEILSESETSIEARMKGFGENFIKVRPGTPVAEEDYLRFFEKKWETIAGVLDLEYKQRIEEGWIFITISTKR